MKLYEDFNQAIDETMFLQNCKLADITHVHENDNKMESNYRPVSILPAMIKIFRRILCYQLAIYFGDKLSNFQCGFRKGYSAQLCLIIMLEKWKQAMDKRSFIYSF